MKPTRSLFQLAAAISFWRVLLILLGLGVVQTGVALWMLQTVTPDQLALEHILDHPLFRFSPAVALTLVMVTLLYSHGGTRSRVDYTMCRLSVPKRTLTICYCFYTVGVFLLCWFFQVAMAAWTSVLYQRLIPKEFWSHQLLLLTSYRSVYLHPLLPMYDWPFWIATPLMYAGLGISATLGIQENWEGKLALWPIILGVCTALNGARSGDYAWAVVLCTLVLIGVCYGFYKHTVTQAQEVMT